MCFKEAALGCSSIIEVASGSRQQESVVRCRDQGPEVGQGGMQSLMQQRLMKRIGIRSGGGSWQGQPEG